MVELTKHHFVARDVAGDDYFEASFGGKYLSEASARPMFHGVLLALLRTLPEDERTPQSLDLYVVDADASQIERHYGAVEYDGPPGDWYVKEI